MLNIKYHQPLTLIIKNPSKLKILPSLVLNIKIKNKPNKHYKKFSGLPTETSSI